MPSPTPPLERVLVSPDRSRPVSYLEQGLARARAVGRVVLNLPSGGMGTGFLVSPGVMITLHHVIESAEMARGATLQFDYAERRDGSLPPISELELEPDRLFVTDRDLDFTLVAVKPRSRTGEPALLRGFIPLPGGDADVEIGEPLNVIHHGFAEPLQIAFRDTRLLGFYDAKLQYGGELGPGSGGAPVFNDRWELVGIHHASRQVSGHGRVLEGIRASSIAEHLRRIGPAALPPEVLTGGSGDGMPPEGFGFGLDLEKLVATSTGKGWVALEAEVPLEFAPSAPPERDLVFISYARADQANGKWADRLLAQLRAVPALRVRAWHDSEIEAGDQWRAEIDDALARARVAVLMVGPGFFNSEFITDHEMPPLREANRLHGVRIIPLVTDFVAYDLSELADIQAFNDYNKPLESLPLFEQNQVMVNLVREVARVFKEAGGG